jgi:malonyl-CoA decarboxylase
MAATNLQQGDITVLPPESGGPAPPHPGERLPAPSYWVSIVSALRWRPAERSDEPPTMAETVPTPVPPVSPSFFDRAVGNLRVAWREIAARVAGPAAVAPAPDLPEDDARRLVQRIEECLANRGGEVTARARAAEIGRAYLALSPTGRRRFLNLLADNFGPDRERIDAAIAAYQSATDRSAVSAAVVDLREASVPPRVRLLTQLTSLPDGFKFLVDLRAELLKHLAGDKTLAGLDRDLQTLFTAWFDIGLLTLERITWDSPAALLEKLIAYEAVHEIRSWTDLKNRLDADRRCYAFFHPRMPGEPLIFVEVALVAGMADNIQKLLDESAPHVDPQTADAAIFYSISNTQTGLRGISFGNFLIKRVVDDLSHELPKIKTFATLSPIPGFRAWLDRNLAEGDGALLTAPELARLAQVPLVAVHRHGLRSLLGDLAWPQDTATAEALAPILRRLCARYLLQEKSNGKPLDSVARFHLANGARIERLNWLADTSAKGLQESAGLMVNYLYRLAEIETNHEAYVAEARIAAASAVKALLKT